MFDYNHQGVVINKLDSNLAMLKTCMKELRDHDMDYSEMQNLYKEFQGKI